MDINTQLAQLLYDYSSKNKIADTIFWLLLHKILIRGWNLEDCVKSYFIFNHNSSPSDYCCYMARLKVIIIYLDKVLNMFESKNYIFDKVFKNKKMHKNRNEIINLTVLQTIMHELEHAKQERIFHIDNPKSVHDVLVKASNIKMLDKKYDTYIEKEKLIFKMLKEEYGKYGLFYNCFPTERFAELKSYNRLIDINTNMSNNYYINEYLNYMKMISSASVYVNSDKSPLEIFIETKENIIKEIITNYSEDSIRNIIASKDNYNWEQKLLYGLPVTKVDWDELKTRFTDNLVERVRSKKFVRYLK